MRRPRSRLAAHGAQFGEPAGGRTRRLVTGELPARHVRGGRVAAAGAHARGRGLVVLPVGDRRV